jgi:hypothetical protein
MSGFDKERFDRVSETIKNEMKILFPTIEVSPDSQTKTSNRIDFTLDL